MYFKNLILTVGWLVFAGTLYTFTEWILPGLGFMVFGSWIIALLVPFRIINRSMAEPVLRNMRQNWFQISSYILLFPLLVLIVIGETLTICRYRIYFDFAAGIWIDTCEINRLWSLSEVLFIIYLLSCGILIFGLIARTNPNALQSAQKSEKLYSRFDSLALHLGYGFIFLGIVPIAILYQPRSFLLIGCVAMFPLSFFNVLHSSFGWHTLLGLTKTLLMLFAFNFVSAIIIIPAFWFSIWLTVNLLSTPSAYLQDLFATYPILEFSAFIGAISLLPVIVVTFLTYKAMRS